MKRIRIYPLIGIASWHKNAGEAYRAWELARCADPKGSGTIPINELKVFMRLQGVPVRTRQMWLKQAVELGLLKPYYNRIRKIHAYFILSIGKTAITLGCDKVGGLADIELKLFIKPGWKNIVWGGYEKSFKGPASQETKENITGVSTRTQRAFLRNLPVRKVKYYANRGIKDPARYLSGQGENLGKILFETKSGEIAQRLPNRIEVPSSVAIVGNKNRRAQKIVDNNLRSGMQVKVIDEYMPRLFCATERQLDYQAKKADEPREVFVNPIPENGARIWEVMYI